MTAARSASSVCQTMLRTATLGAISATATGAMSVARGDHWIGRA
jgi:hypothetical protein